jgi:putative membrane protein
MKKRHHLGTIGTLLGSLTLTGLALTAALALPAVSLAADTKGAAATLSSGDKDFIMEAACGGMAEVSLGELAQQKGTSEAVKQFGKHMVDDHSKANNELKELAGRKGVVVPAALKPKYQKVVDSLSKLSGAEFDKQYMREMVKDHENDVSAFQKEADKGKDSELTSWAKQTLPTLQDHLKMARDAETKVKGG